MEKKRAKLHRRRREEEDPRDIVAKVSEELLKRLGMEGLIEPAELSEIVEEVVQNMMERGRKVEESLVLKKLEEKRDGIYKYVASKLLSGDRELDLAKAEFLMFRAPELAGRAAPRLYKEVLKDPSLLSMLRTLWERYGLPLPLRCPRCGFMSITPELSCIVCGAAPSEEEVKRANNFEEELKRAVQGWHESLIMEVVSAGYVYFDGEIRPPSMGKGQGVILHLNQREKGMLRDLLVKRR
ncbi:MAG: hypothetical protein NZ902_05295 [Acidilobaceae archaeon]|nr:hypothetical protein [Acidilobaceae archaeon]MCX8165982.1 hypothetical protein [Acidilobaceae archaeon]MDW7974625.1 hypothetical protein [Sulfolobales archaeon]